MPHMSPNSRGAFIGSHTTPVLASGGRTGTGCQSHPFRGKSDMQIARSYMPFSYDRRPIWAEASVVIRTTRRTFGLAMFPRARPTHIRLKAVMGPRR
jgi:hypothetical protein